MYLHERSSGNTGIAISAVFVYGIKGTPVRTSINCTLLVECSRLPENLYTSGVAAAAAEKNKKLNEEGSLASTKKNLCLLNHSRCIFLFIFFFPVTEWDAEVCEYTYIKKYRRV